MCVSHVCVGQACESHMYICSQMCGSGLCVQSHMCVQSDVCGLPRAHCTDALRLPVKSFKLPTVLFPTPPPNKKPGWTRSGHKAKRSVRAGALSTCRNQVPPAPTGIPQLFHLILGGGSDSRKKASCLSRKPRCLSRKPRCRGAGHLPPALGVGQALLWPGPRAGGREGPGCPAFTVKRAAEPSGCRL